MPPAKFARACRAAHWSPAEGGAKMWREGILCGVTLERDLLCDRYCIGCRRTAKGRPLTMAGSARSLQISTSRRSVQPSYNPCGGRLMARLSIPAVRLPVARTPTPHDHAQNAQPSSYHVKAGSRRQGPLPQPLQVAAQPCHLASLWASATLSVGRLHPAMTHKLHTPSASLH